MSFLKLSLKFAYKYINIKQNLQEITSPCTNVGCLEENGCSGNQCVKMGENQPAGMAC